MDSSKANENRGKRIVALFIIALITVLFSVVLWVKSRDPSADQYSSLLKEIETLILRDDFKGAEKYVEKLSAYDDKLVVYLRISDIYAGLGEHKKNLEYLKEGEKCLLDEKCEYSDEEAYSLYRVIAIEGIRANSYDTAMKYIEKAEEYDVGNEARLDLLYDKAGIYLKKNDLAQACRTIAEMKPLLQDVGTNKTSFSRNYDSLIAETDCELETSN